MGSMKQIAMIVLLTFSLAVKSEPLDYKAWEDSLLTIRTNSLETESDSLKLLFNKKLKETWLTVLSDEHSIDYPFDSIKSIGFLKSDDQSMRIINWELQLTDNSILYFAIIQFKTKKKNSYRLLELNDQSSSIKKPEKVVLEANNWYGAHYYKLVESHYKKKKYYTLLGANFSDPLIKKKVVEILNIQSDGKIKFGQSVFLSEKSDNKRIIFQYSPEISMSLRYEESIESIIFDHLVPRAAGLVGQFGFYGPDFSFDAFRWKKGKWTLEEDIDARNKRNR